MDLVLRLREGTVQIMTPSLRMDLVLRLRELRECFNRMSSGHGGFSLGPRERRSVAGAAARLRTGRFYCPNYLCTGLPSLGDFLSHFLGLAPTWS